MTPGYALTRTASREPARARALGLWDVLSFLGLFVGLIGLVVFRADILLLSLASLGKLTVLCAIVTVGVVGRTVPNGFWAPSTVYLVVLSLFHFGLTWVLGFGLLSDEATDAVAQWLYRPSTPEAVFLACLGLLACGLGILSAHIVATRGTTRQARAPRGDVDRAESRLLTWVGVPLVVGSVAAWFGLVARAGGPSLLVGSYVDYLNAMQINGGLTAFVWFGMGFGLCFLAASESTKWHRLAYCAFALFALAGLPVGLRGEVLFPSVAAFVVSTKWRRPPPTALFLAGAVAILIVIPVIKDVRQVGIGNASSVSGNPLDGLTEMGASLRPVAEVLQWRYQGDELENGATYWAPFDRVLCRLGSRATCVPAEDDERITGTLVLNRVGAIGFSPIAEAFRNFGSSGVAAVMFLVGLLLGRMDRWPPTRFRLALVGVIYVELLINVRNSFVAAPSHIIFGVSLLVVIMLVARSLTRGAAHAPVSGSARSLDVRTGAP